jgi:hypothetical protein
MAENHSSDAEESWSSVEVAGQELVSVPDDIWKLYNAGKPLFSSALLEDLDRQLALRPEKVSITGIDCVEYDFGLNPPLFNEEGRAM